MDFLNFLGENFKYLINSSIQFFFIVFNLLHKYFLTSQLRFIIQFLTLFECHITKYRNTMRNLHEMEDVLIHKIYGFLEFLK